jgi:ethanolamine-phosphate phospho-lyase
MLYNRTLHAFFRGSSRRKEISIVAIMDLTQARRRGHDNYDQHSFEEVKELRQKHFSSRVSVSYSNSTPLMIVSGTKCRLIDHLGNAYLDTRNNVCHVGHQHPHVVQKVQEQVQTLNTNTRYLHPNATLLAQRLSDLLPDSLHKVFFVNSGSEANDLALRLAKAHANVHANGTTEESTTTHTNNNANANTNKHNFICVDHAYHGHTLATLEVSPYKYKKSKEFAYDYDATNHNHSIDRGIDVDSNSSMSRSPGRHIVHVPCPDTYRGRHRENDAAERYAEYVQDACHTIRNRGENVTAFIIEGGMSVGGVILPPPTYLALCSDAVRSAGGLVIADEVQTGLGRLGDPTSPWAFQHGGSDVVPDIVTVGKPFGNGMPLAAVVTTEKVADAFDAMGVEYFNTFGGNPVSCAAGLAVLDVLEEEGLVENASKVGMYLIQKIWELKNGDAGIDAMIGDVRGSGLFVGIELVRDSVTLEPATAETSFLCSTLKEKYRVLTSIDGPHDNVLVVKPPMVFSHDDVDEFISALASAFRDLSTVDVESISLTPT